MSRSFVANVISGNMVTIPNSFADHHDIRKGDTVELEVTSHKRDGEKIFDINEE